MKKLLKNLFKKLWLYYFLQGSYTDALQKKQRNKNREAYKPFEGSGFVCNNCGHAYSRFVPAYPLEPNREAIAKYNIIIGFGENIYCPYCMCGARERLVLAMLQHKIDIKDKKILHLSPEKSIYDYIAPKATVITGDIEPGFYKRTAPDIITLDATAFTFDDNTFDIIIGNHMLEHIPEDAKAMKEFYRILKPGGTAILQVPYSATIPATLEEPYINDRARQSALFGQNDHIRIYQLDNYLERLQNAGFTVNYITPAELHAMFPTYIFQPGEGFFSLKK